MFGDEGTPIRPAAAPAPDRSQEFAAQFKAAFRTLWLIAAGVVKDTALADDVVQEAAVVALGKLDQFQPGTNFTAWMGQVVRYVALNQARQRRRTRAISLDAATTDETSYRTRTATSSAELRVGPGGTLPADQPYFDDRIQRALEGVSDVARICLLLRTVEGLEYSEISRLLGIPEGTAMSHVHRTRRYLRERLSAGGTEGTTGGDS